MIHFYNNYCENLKNQQRLRQLSQQKYDNVLLDFSTNDYLGLSKHPKLLEHALLYGKNFGVGATGSRLLSGNKLFFEPFEKQIAKDKKTEAALIFNSGYQTNVGVLSALLDPNVLNTQALVFFDMLNHSSLYQGIFISKAQLVRYKHNNMDDLAHHLEKHRDDPRPKFIISLTLFGMDGDIVDLQTLAELAKQYKALLYLDEAHATGVLGQNGYGLSTGYSFDGVIMGTFSKGLGGSGGYIACNQSIKEYLVNKCSGFIYSTAPSPMVIGAAEKAWEMLPDFDEARKTLMENATYVRGKLSEMGFDTGTSTTHIIPIILGSEETALNIKNELLNHGIIVSAIRPPTVPIGMSRIRIALTTNHTLQDLERLLSTLSNLKNRVKDS